MSGSYQIQTVTFYLGPSPPTDMLLLQKKVRFVFLAPSLSLLQEVSERSPALGGRCTGGRGMRFFTDPWDSLFAFRSVCTSCSLKVRDTSMNQSQENHPLGTTIACAHCLGLPASLLCGHPHLVSLSEHTHPIPLQSSMSDSNLRVQRARGMVRGWAREAPPWACECTRCAKEAPC